jgi:triosephosphate isomerase
MESFIFAANWKLHKTPGEVKDFFAELGHQLSSSAWHGLAGHPGVDSGLKSKKRFCQVFFPPAPLWQVVDQELKSLKSGVSLAGGAGARGCWAWGAQNCWAELSGAFTGESSLSCLKAMGGEWVLVGHSERRAIFGETDDLLAKKFWKSIEVGISPMLCVGETREERDSGRTEEVVTRQLQTVFQGGVVPQSFQLAVAYEPVWAIGTGLVATLQMISQAHGLIRKILGNFGLSSVPVLYGGSVKPENVAEIVNLPEVGGVLVGGASLAPASWMQLLLESL